MKTRTSIQVGSAVLALVTASPAFAGVKFRVGYEASSSEYVVYMTPDSLPKPDMVLSSQVTLVVPHATGAASFGANSIQSSVAGLNWANNSRVNAPAENAKADYLSFGLFYTASRPPSFAWAVGQEKRIFSFKSPTGCVAGVALLDNSDPFSQLPNSVGTNPGNEFSNIGWIGGNAYVGNYGNSVACGATPPPPPPPVAACEKDPGRVGAVLRESWALDTEVNRIRPAAEQANLRQKLNELRTILACQP